jgi:DNA-binding NarL/FixJ family response regulator
MAASAGTAMSGTTRAKPWLSAALRGVLADPRLTAVPVVMLTTFDDDEYLFDAIRASAAGFLLKDTAPEALREAVRTVAGGAGLLSPAVTRRVLAATSWRRSAPAAAMPRSAPCCT